MLIDYLDDLDVLDVDDLDDLDDLDSYDCQGGHFMRLAPHMAKGGKYRKETLPLFVLLRNATIVQVNLYVNEKRKI